MMNRLRRYVPYVFAAAAGLALGLFVARVLYELWPARWLALASWPAGPALALGVVALVVGLYHRLGSRVGLKALFPWIVLSLYVFQPEVNLLQAAVLFLGVAALSLLYVLQTLGAGGEDWPERWGLRLLLVASCLALYLPTMGRTVGEADSFEFQVVAPALGVAHPTGYPLYILLAKLFSLLPFGQVAWRVNLASVACATLAAGVVYVVTGRVLALLPPRPGTEASCEHDAQERAQRALLRYCSRYSARYSGFVAALSLAASAVFWSQAIVAEVYALNAVFVALILGLLSHGIERHQRDPAWDARSWLFALALVYGLSLTNHLTMALLAPGLLLAACWVRPRAGRGGWLAALGLFGLGLSVYGYILVRWPALHQGQLMALPDFIDWITGRQFGGALQFELWRQHARWQIVGRLLLEAYGPAGAALAGLGALGLAFRHWRTAALTGLAFVGYCAYAVVYNVPDISVFLIPAHIVMAIWMGVGIFLIVNGQLLIVNCQRVSRLQSLVSRLRSLSFRLAPSFGRVHSLFPTPYSLLPTPYSLLPLSPILQAIVLLLPLSLIWTNWPVVDQSRSGQAWMDWGRYVLSLPLPRQALILADSEKIAPLYYLKRIEGVRSDLDVLVMGSEELYRAELDKRVAQGEPVYLARFLPGLAGVYHLHSLGPLVRVSTTPQTDLPLSPITRRLKLSFGGGRLNLLGYDLATGSGEVAYRLSLYWQAREALPANYHVRLRLVSEGGTAWWQEPGTHPAGGYNPTAAWWPGEVVSDYHEIPLVRSFPPGRYRLEIGLFVPFSDVGLRLDASAGELWYNLGWVDVNKAAEAVSAPLAGQTRAVFGDQVLLREAERFILTPPAGRGELNLEWEKLPLTGSLGLDYLQVTLARDDGTPLRNGVPVQVFQVKPYQGEYPVTRWEPGRRLPMQVDFNAPDQAGQYILRVGWIDGEGQPVPARCGWMAPLSYECPLASLRVEGARREAGVNFADQVVMVRSQLHESSLRPGGTLKLDLRWQGLKAWPADYTAFVHLIGPDGKLYGQVDAYPVYGTLPTSQWKAGQIVDDPYTVTLAANAPPGEYQVEVGWYLLATLRRLSVLDAAGRPVDDRVIVGKLTVMP
ncbi:MAG: DUF2723 domain-containing protein [Thermoflexales bacterium]|nr:DUF2723 domain-containing protein [Thermoflexales bacterium]